MIDWVKNNPGWKLFALAIAVFLWSSFSETAATEAFVKVPIEYRGLANTLEISSGVVDTVTVDLRGPADGVKRFSDSPSAALLDFSTINRAGEHTVSLDGSNISLPGELTLVRVIPSQLRFQFEARTSRDVPVEVKFAGKPPAGYRLVRFEALPPSIQVVGPESQVNKVNSADTDAIDLSTVVGSTTFSVSAYIGNPQVRVARPAKIAVRIEIEKAPE